MGVVGTRAVLDDVGINQVRRVEVRERTVMAQLNRGLGGIEDDRVQVGELEVIGRRPVSNLVGRRNSPDTPEPCVPIIKVGLQGERVVGHVKACIVPRGVGKAVHRREITLRVKLNNETRQRH